MQLTVYSILHFLVDGICAFSMYRRFIHTDSGWIFMLVYNFCAFALQLPFGSILDYLLQQYSESRIGRKSPFLFACAGVLLTVIGSMVSPVILGIGNALFHVGGGVSIIHRDATCKSHGVQLGVFVAPGAFGLYLGKLLAGSDAAGTAAAVPFAAVLAILFGSLLRKRCETAVEMAEPCGPIGRSEILPLLGCFLVVVLRSYAGLTISFSWKSLPLLGLLAIFAVVGGKMLGGFFAAKTSPLIAACSSLTAAAVCYLFGELPAAGIAALLLFNMTMPITLYWPVRRHPQYAGTFFGLLTLALFLGFIPVWLGISLPYSANLSGMICSLLSLALLLPALLRKQ